MPRLAIVISAVGSIESLESTLVSVLENRPPDCEIVVALGAAYADPYQLQGEVQFVEPRGRVNRVALLNEAIAATRAHFVHLLASGCTVCEGWVEPALQRFGDRQVASVAPVAIDASSGRIFAAGIGYRSSGGRLLVAHGETTVPSKATTATIGAGSFAAFYRKAAWERVGRFCDQLGLDQADVDLALTLKAAGYVGVVEQNARVTVAPASQSSGDWLDALHEERLFWRNLPSRGRPAALAAHLGMAGLEVARRLPRLSAPAHLAGRIVGCCQWGSYARRRAMLRHLAAQTTQATAERHGTRIDRSHDAPAPARSGAPAGTVTH